MEGGGRPLSHVSNLYIIKIRLFFCRQWTSPGVHRSSRYLLCPWLQGWERQASRMGFVEWYVWARVSLDDADRIPYLRVAYA
jgi:hypothetical protein